MNGNKLKVTRHSAGHYKAAARGIEFDIINHSHYGACTTAWNLLIDGVCGDSFITKREAVEAAEWFPTGDESMKTYNGKNMNGLTSSEVKQLAFLKAQARVDINEAKRIAVAWINANSERQILRRAACRCVEGLRS